MRFPNVYWVLLEPLNNRCSHRGKRLFSAVGEGRLITAEGIRYGKEISSSTVEDVQNCRGIPSALWLDTIGSVGDANNTVEDVQY